MSTIDPEEMSGGSSIEGNSIYARVSKTAGLDLRNNNIIIMRQQP